MPEKRKQMAVLSGQEHMLAAHKGFQATGTLCMWEMSHQPVS